MLPACPWLKGLARRFAQPKGLVLSASRLRGGVSVSSRSSGTTVTRRGRSRAAAAGGRSRSAARRSRATAALAGTQASQQATATLGMATAATASTTTAITAPAATAAATASTTATAMEQARGSLLLGTHQGNAEHREKHRDAKKQCTIHTKLLPLNRYRYRKGLTQTLPSNSVSIPNRDGLEMGRDLRSISWQRTAHHTLAKYINDLSGRRG